MAKGSKIESGLLAFLDSVKAALGRKNIFDPGRLAVRTGQEFGTRYKHRELERERGYGRAPTLGSEYVTVPLEVLGGSVGGAARKLEPLFESGLTGLLPSGGENRLDRGEGDLVGAGLVGASQGGVATPTPAQPPPPAPKVRAAASDSIAEEGGAERELRQEGEDLIPSILRFGRGDRIESEYNPRTGKVLSAEEAGFTPYTSKPGVSTWTKAPVTPTMKEDTANDLEMKLLAEARKRYKVQGIDPPLTREEYLQLQRDILRYGGPANEAARRTDLRNQMSDIESQLSASKDPAETKRLKQAMTRLESEYQGMANLGSLNPTI